MECDFDLALTPLTDIYFEPSSDFDNVKHGDKAVVYIFLSIAILILIIACINFMNLSTIRAVERSKEVGLRKVMGALEKQPGLAVYRRVFIADFYFLRPCCRVASIADAFLQPVAGLHFKRFLE